MTTFNLVGLTGVAQSGKDTAAQVLIKRFGFKRVAFADPLRAMLYALNPKVDDIPNGFRVRNYVDSWGWDVAKKNPEIRALLQRIGTEAGRHVLGDNVWTDLALRQFDALDKYNCKCGSTDCTERHRFVVTDVRFNDEAEAIRSRGGIVIAVERPGVTAVNDHASEAGISPHLVTHYIRNTGTVEQLHAQVIAVLNL